MKKIISVWIILCTTLSCIVFPSKANELDQVTFYYLNGVEVTIEIVDGLTYDKIKKVADHLAGEKMLVPGDHIMLNPQCAAGNHDLITATAICVKHNVYTGSFKCLEERYIVSTCNRIGCDYMTEELFSSQRINTCHG